MIRRARPFGRRLLVAVGLLAVPLTGPAPAWAADTPPVTWATATLSRVDYPMVAHGRMNGRGDIAATAWHWGVNSDPVLWTADGGDLVVLTPPPGITSGMLSVTDLNDAGLVACAGGILSPRVPVSQEGYLWQAGVATPITGVPGGKTPMPVVLNNRGQVVVDRLGVDVPTNRTYLWEPGSTQALPFTGVIDINDRAEVLGVRDGRTLLWRAGELADLGTVNGSAVNATALNNRGQVIGAVPLDPVGDPDGASRPVLWEGGVMTDLLAGTGASTGVVHAINDAGQAVGAVGDRPVLWRDGHPTFLAPAGTSGDALKINRSGEVVGLLSGGDLPPGRHLFTWKAGRLNLLDPPSDLTVDSTFEVVGIDDLGRVGLVYWTVGGVSALARTALAAPGRPAGR